MSKEGNGTWKLADVGRVLRNSFSAVLNGTFLLRLNAGRYFVHIIYAFVMFGLIIWLSLLTDATMAKVEKNRKEIAELQIANTQKTCELVSLTRRSAVEARLVKMGSEVGEPGSNATVIR